MGHSWQSALLRTTLAASVAYALALSPAQADFDIPTGAPPSPLFGALPFTAQMLHLEEFGTKPMPATTCTDCQPLPAPATCDASPDADSFDAYMKQPLWPMPTRLANTTLANPWEAQIEACLGRDLATSAVEGRPSGEWFAHQRYDEFQPAVFTHAAQAGARVNTGLRDSLQRHKYMLGEFGPGGLYHRGGTTAGVRPRFHPNFPDQLPNSLWTHDGTFPMKLMIGRYGEGILFRHHNALPIDDSANRGFGVHTISTHLHNAHNPAEVDGFANAFFFPGQYYDYRWPMILAGYDAVNTAATDPRAGRPNGAGGVTRIRGDWRETMSTLWFHDHMLDATAQNVYKGNIAVMNIFSAIDRGKEGYGCHYNDPAAPLMPTNAGYVNLCFPSGTALDWGNRDYDVDLVFADKAWDSKGQLYFNKFNFDGFLGDRVTVNGVYKPYFNVRARKYRLRILGGSVSRYWKFAIVTASGQRVPFHMIVNDGNIMEHAVAYPNAAAQELPTQGIGERFDIVVDFKPYAPGTKLYFVNLMEHDDGKGPKRVVPLNEIMNGSYRGDPAVGKVLEFRVHAYTGIDRSMNPADYVEGKKKMVPRAMPTCSRGPSRPTAARAWVPTSTASPPRRPRARGKFGMSRPAAAGRIPCTSTSRKGACSAATTARCVHGRDGPARTCTPSATRATCRAR
jgi:manganese oxidase